MEHIYIHTHTHINTCINILAGHARQRPPLAPYIHTYMHTHMHKYSRRACQEAFSARSIHTYTHTYIHTHTHTTMHKYSRRACQAASSARSSSYTGVPPTARTPTVGHQFSRHSTWSCPSSLCPPCAWTRFLAVAAAAKTRAKITAGKATVAEAATLWVR